MTPQIEMLIDANEAHITVEPGGNATNMRESRRNGQTSSRLQ